MGSANLPTSLGKLTTPGLGRGGGGGVRHDRGHGQAGRLRAPGARGARRPLREVVVHRRAGVPEVGGGRAGRARGRLCGGHRLRRLRDRGVRPRVRGRHAGQAGPGDVPDPALARRRTRDSADVLRHRHAGRLTVVRRPAARAQAHPQQGGREGLHVLHAPRDRVLPVQGPARARAPSRSLSTAAGSSTTPRPARARTSAARRSRCSSRWASRSSSATTRAGPASRRSTCATPTR